MTNLYPWRPLITLLSTGQREQAQATLAKLAKADDNVASEVASDLASRAPVMQARILPALSGLERNLAVRAACLRILNTKTERDAAAVVAAMLVLKPLKNEIEVRDVILKRIEDGDGSVQQAAYEVIYGDIDQSLGSGEPDRIDRDDDSTPAFTLIPDESQRKEADTLLDELLKKLRQLEDAGELNEQQQEVIGEAIGMVEELRGLLRETAATEAELALHKRLGRRMVSGSKRLLEAAKWGIPTAAYSDDALRNAQVALTKASDLIEPFLQ